MTKELYVSSTPHETRVGMVEDDQLAEIYLERENEYTLAGSIYKGRVTRVLPRRRRKARVRFPARCRTPLHRAKIQHPQQRLVTNQMEANRVRNSAKGVATGGAVAAVADGGASGCPRASLPVPQRSPRVRSAVTAQTSVPRRDTSR